MNEPYQMSMSEAFRAKCVDRVVKAWLNAWSVEPDAYETICNVVNHRIIYKFVEKTDPNKAVMMRTLNAFLSDVAYTALGKDADAQTILSSEAVNYLLTKVMDHVEVANRWVRARMMFRSVRGSEPGPDAVMLVQADGLTAEVQNALLNYGFVKYDAGTWLLTF